MPLAWVLHKGSGRVLSLSLLVTVCGAFTASQQAPKQRVTRTPRQIILPPKVIAGAQATLAVLDTQGRLLPNAPVELSNGQKLTTDATGRVLFKAPDQLGKMTAKISGHAIIASSAVLPSEDSGTHPATDDPAAGLKVISHPHFLTLQDRFTLGGSGFQGAADSNHVTLNGDPCLILASSPLSIVALPGPGVPVGDVSLHVTVAGVDATPIAVSTVMLEFTGPTEAANAGSSGELILHAHGTTEPLLVEVRNGSPKVIELSKGDAQRLKTSGGEENIAAVEVKFLSGGNYAISARLLSAW